MDRGSRGFPQEEEFSTESYPQVWITLGIRPFHGDFGLFKGFRSCGKLNGTKKEIPVPVQRAGTGVTEKLNQKEVYEKTVCLGWQQQKSSIFSVPGSVLRFPGSIPDLAVGLSGSFHRHG